MSTHISEQGISLVVLQHGLWGVKGHMGYIEKKLVQKYQDSIYILNTSVNEAKYSYDGIDICGRRLAEEIESLVVRLGKTGKPVTRISMIGYSLGGLIVRYAIGALGQKGFFNTIQPEYFITFATPHMGVKVPSSSVRSTVFNYLSGRLVSRSGEQLQLIDKYDKEGNKTMLEVLSEPDQIYFKYLSKFKIRRSYANLANDRTVPYWTAGMEIKDYFFESKGKLDLILDETYSSILTGYDIKVPGNTKRKPSTKEKKTFKSILLIGLFYLLFPIAFPIFFVFAFTTISIQGLVSRYRVSRLLSHKSLLFGNSNEEITLDHKRASEGDRYVNGEILAGALDAVNLPGDETPPSIKRSNSTTYRRNTTNPVVSSDGTINEDTNKKDDNDYYFQVKPPTTVEEKAKILPFDETTKRIYKNIRMLDWQVVWVYIRAFNAHGGIVCRQKIHTTEAGEATIQHFIDTTQFS